MRSILVWIQGKKYNNGEISKENENKIIYKKERESKWVFEMRVDQATESTRNLR